MSLRMTTEVLDRTWGVYPLLSIKNPVFEINDFESMANSSNYGVLSEEELSDEDLILDAQLIEDELSLVNKEDIERVNMQSILKVNIKGSDYFILNATSPSLAFVSQQPLTLSDMKFKTPNEIIETYKKLEDTLYSKKFFLMAFYTSVGVPKTVNEINNIIINYKDQEQLIEKISNKYRNRLNRRNNNKIPTLPAELKCHVLMQLQNKQAALKLMSLDKEFAECKPFVESMEDIDSSDEL